MFPVTSSSTRGTSTRSYMHVRSGDAVRAAASCFILFHSSRCEAMCQQGQTGGRLQAWTRHFHADMSVACFLVCFPAQPLNEHWSEIVLIDTSCLLSNSTEIQTLALVNISLFRNGNNQHSTSWAWINLSLQSVSSSTSSSSSSHNFTHHLLPQFVPQHFLSLTLEGSIFSVINSTHKLSIDWDKLR